MMNLTDECFQWFRFEAEKFPIRVKLDIINIIDDKNLFDVHKNLREMFNEGKLNEHWDEKLTEFFFLIH